MLEIKHLKKTIKKNLILDSFSFEFKSGAYAILGPNGAGKTTLLRCITQIYPVEKDTIFSDGIDICCDDNYLDSIGYLPQNFGCFKEITIREAMELIGNLKGIAAKEINHRIDECLKLTNLSHYSDTKIGTLSGGTVRRFGIAQALISNPKYILLDEPTVGLDPVEVINFNHIICEIKKKHTVIVSTHLVEDIEYVFDEIIIMDKGKVQCYGNYNNIISLAKGKVYEIPKSEMPELHGEFIIQKNYFRDDGLECLRVLTNSPLKYKQVDPALRDGYLCAIKNI